MSPWLILRAILAANCLLAFSSDPGEPRFGKGILKLSKESLEGVIGLARFELLPGTGMFISSELRKLVKSRLPSGIPDSDRFRLDRPGNVGNPSLLVRFEASVLLMLPNPIPADEDGLEDGPC